MRKILALGYHHLPIHLKACLLYLSIFPEDYIILADRLIWRWICEGFLHGVQEENLFELGESCLTELINRGLIQHVDSNTYGWTADGCRVHDLVLDLISSICIEKNFCTVLYDKKATSTAITSKVRRLFLQLQDTEMPQARMILSHVRSLTVFGSRDSVEKMPPLSFFPRLRVLDLKDYVLQDQCHTHEHLGSLCQLRYLDLGSAYLDEFLLEIHIGQQKNLICLQAGFYCKITFRPGVIRKLEALQVLSSISLSKSPHIAKELRHLIKLMVLAFSLEGIPDESLKGWILESLCHLENLQSLFVHVHYNLGGACLDFVGEGWIPPPRNLRRFLSPFGTFSYLPSWISPSNLRELSIIEIGLGHLRQEDLDILGSFPALQSLQLSYYKNIWDEERKQWPVVSADTFPCLRECGLGLLPKGGNMFAPGAMPNVHILRFHCQIDDVSSLGLENLPSLHDSLGLDNLPSLQELHVRLREFIGRPVSREEYNKARAAFRCAADNHPNRPTLELHTRFMSS